MIGWRTLGGAILAWMLVFGACGGGDDSGIDSGGGGSCPSDMVYVSGADVCIDAYESSQGASDQAVSAASATPWVSVTQGEAAAACEAAGKRLCERSEWEAACQGPSGNEFPYGDTYDPEACNGADHQEDALVPTGSMTDCEGGVAGLYDMSGNVSEWTATCTSSNCRNAGGSFTGPESTLSCTSGSTVPSSSTGLVLGFRCCQAAD